MACGKKTEVFSRVVGYHRPVKNWNKGKKEEFKDRTPYNDAARVPEAKADIRQESVCERSQ